MTGYKRVFLGCWISLDEQDRLCEVSLDSSVDEVSGPSDQQIDSIFQACKSPMKSVINRPLTYLLSVTIESRYAAREMYPPILSSYSKTSPPFRSRLILANHPGVLHNYPRNVLGQTVIQEWQHGARVEPRRAFHRDIEVDLFGIPRRRSTRSASQTILATVLLHPESPWI